MSAAVHRQGGGDVSGDGISRLPPASAGRQGGPPDVASEDLPAEHHLQPAEVSWSPHFAKRTNCADISLAHVTSIFCYLWENGSTYASSSLKSIGSASVS